MSYLRKIRTHLNKQLPMWIRGRVVPKGIVLPIDPYMQGTVRCAKKLGDRMPVIVPDNEMRLTASLAQKQSTITIDAAPTYLTYGYLISLANRQVVKIGGLLDKTITFLPDPNLPDEQQGSRIDLPSGSPVQVYGIPGVNVANVAVKDTIIAAKFPFPVAPGDVIAISTQVSGIFREYEITSVNYDDYLIKPAKVTVNGNSVNGNVTYIAKMAGTAGNAISIRHVNDGNGQLLSVEVVGSDIIVHLGTDAHGSVTTTAHQLVQAVNSSIQASALVMAYIGGDGSDSVTVYQRTNLAGGIQEANPYYYQLEVAAIKAVTDLPDFLSPAALDVLSTSDGPGFYRALESGETIYLRAFPAYFSKFIPLPTLYPSSTAAIGPYVLDRVSGLLGDNPAGDGVALSEFLDIQFYYGETKLNNIRLRQDAPTAANDVQSQQYPIWSSPIFSEHMILWQVDCGSLQMSPSSIIMIGDDSGECKIHKELAPEPGTCGDTFPKFRITGNSKAPFKLLVNLFPSHIASQEATTPDSDGIYRVAFDAEVGKIQPRSIAISTRGSPGQEVSVHSLTPHTMSVSHVKYQIVAKTAGRYHWASSGLLLKPEFLSARLSDTYGLILKQDNGLAMLDEQTTFDPSVRLQRLICSLSVTMGPAVEGTHQVVTAFVEGKGGKEPYIRYTFDWGDTVVNTSAAHIGHHLYAMGPLPVQRVVKVSVTDTFETSASRFVVITIPQAGGSESGIKVAGRKKNLRLATGTEGFTL